LKFEDRRLDVCVGERSAIYFIILPEKPLYVETNPNGDELFWFDRIIVIHAMYLFMSTKLLGS